MTNKAKGKGKKKQKTMSVSKKVLNQMRLSSRVETLEQAMKQLQGKTLGLMQHLESSRKLNAHYLVSINTLAKAMIDHGLCTNASLSAIRAGVIDDAEFDRQKHDWLEKSAFYDSTTDKWFFWDMACADKQGPFLDESSAQKAAISYLTKVEMERLAANPAQPEPKLLVDRVTAVEHQDRLDMSSVPPVDVARPVLVEATSAKPADREGSRELQEDYLPDQATDSIRKELDNG